MTSSAASHILLIKMLEEVRSVVLLTWSCAVLQTGNRLLYNIQKTFDLDLFHCVVFTIINDHGTQVTLNF